MFIDDQSINRKGWSFNLIGGANYTVFLHQRSLPQVELKNSPLMNANEPPGVLLFNSTNKLIDANLKFYLSDPASAAPIALSASLTDAKQFGAYVFSTSPYGIKVIYSGSRIGTVALTPIHCTINCGDGSSANVGPVPSQATNLWSDPNIWPDKTVPLSNTDVVIPENLFVTIDVASLVVRSLTVNGQLQVGKALPKLSI